MLMGVNPVAGTVVVAGIVMVSVNAASPGLRLRDMCKSTVVAFGSLLRFCVMLVPADDVTVPNTGNGVPPLTMRMVFTTLVTAPLPSTIG